MNLLSNKWKILIIRGLLTDTKRYGELKRNIDGISEKMLTQSLKEMVQDQLIIRKAYPEIPPKVEYSLSEIGITLRPIIDSMKVWGIEYKNKIS